MCISLGMQGVPTDTEVVSGSVDASCQPPQLSEQSRSAGIKHATATEPSKQHEGPSQSEVISSGPSHGHQLKTDLQHNVVTDINSQKIESLVAELRSQMTSLLSASVMPGHVHTNSSPEHIQQAQQTIAEKNAARPAQHIKKTGNLSSMRATGQTSQQVPESGLIIDKVTPAAINNAISTVYPGHNGEPVWTKWKGK